jgi:protein O-GlcNAc transferase
VTTHGLTPNSVPNVKIQLLLQEATAHLHAGRHAVAAHNCALARAAAPADFRTLLVSGATALKQENFADAADWLGRAHRRSRRNASCAVLLGFALGKLGRYAEAEAALRRALELGPSDAEAWDAFGCVLRAEADAGGAIAAHRKAVELMPERALSWHNLGNALQLAGDFSEALAAHECARDADPSLAAAHHGRGLALQSSHRIPEAVAAFGEALALGPGHHEARSCRLRALNYLEGASREKIHAEHLMYGEALGAERRRAFPNTPDPVRRLRIAFLSPDLRTRPIAPFLEPLMAHLEHSRFEVALYHDHVVHDSTLERLHSHASTWRNFKGLSPDAVEASIRADAPDILVDLAGHAAFSRLSLFNRRLAPVQISYLGYPNTSGLRAMDYRFVDAVTDPVGEADALHTERLVRFSQTAWSYAPPPGAPLPGQRRAPGSPATFGCFNDFAKVTDEALGAWARILNAVPGSRLRLTVSGLGEAAIARQIRQRLARAGLDASRVELLCPPAGPAERMALYRDVDVALDTHPYNGRTATCEALWMGVPVVTLAGDRHASRIGASVLGAVGRQGWICRTWDDYVGVSSRLAREGTRESGERLRSDMEKSALLDHCGQARRFARALSDCWAEWCGQVSVAA